jgi:hypothetical protein
MLTSTLIYFVLPASKGLTVVDIILRHKCVPAPASTPIYGPDLAALRLVMLGVSTVGVHTNQYVCARARARALKSVCVCVCLLP